MRGYPTLTGFDDSGRPLFQADRAPVGTLESPTVHLRTGDSASLTWSYYLITGGEVPAGQTCPHYTELRIAPPGAQASMLLASGADDSWGCHHTIGVVVPGSDGDD